MEMVEKVDDLPLETLCNNGTITKATFSKVIIAKNYIERKYNMKNTKAFELNSFLHKVDSLNISSDQKNKLKQKMYDLARVYRHKQTIRNYDSLRLIGKGAYGEVHLCRHKETKEIVAIKKIRKDTIIEKNQIINTKNEQAFLSKIKSPFIVELKASFQEGDYLFLVMEYCPGGDLMSHLIKKDILTEKEAQFYFTELILAIDVIHKADCIHRDIKPDNIIIDKTGHIKLSDFGLAKISENLSGLIIPNEDNLPKHKRYFSCVGTVFYVSPEVLEKKGYGKDIDWWSAGAILYEMLIGHAPFYCEKVTDSCFQIVNWKKFLKFPSKKKISPVAKDLISKLLCGPDERLGKGGVSEILSHPFFKNLDYPNIRKQAPPFIPQLINDYDTKYFEPIDSDDPFYPEVAVIHKRRGVEFIGYTYNENDQQDTVSCVDILNEAIENERKNNSPRNSDCKEQSTIENSPRDKQSVINSNQVRIISLPTKIQIDCSNRALPKTSTTLISVDESRRNNNKAATVTNNSNKFKTSLSINTLQKKTIVNNPTNPLATTSTQRVNTFYNDNITHTEGNSDRAKEQLSQIYKKIKKRTHKSPVLKINNKFCLPKDNYTLSRKFTAVSLGKKNLLYNQ